jgi:hypothetical protein
VAVVLIAVLIPVSRSWLAAAEPPRIVPRGSFLPKSPLTIEQQQLYWRLIRLFPEPEFVVLAQVALAALVRPIGAAKESKVLGRKVDFVLLDRQLRPLAVINYGPSASWGDDRVSRVDQALEVAGYQVVRYKTIPSNDVLRRDLLWKSPPRSGQAN